MFSSTFWLTAIRVEHAKGWADQEQVSSQPLLGKTDPDQSLCGETGNDAVSTKKSNFFSLKLALLGVTTSV